jgi:LMBR1 domain-containing protein 1
MHGLRMQAWFPKGVVVLGISLAIWTVLLFPLDAANQRACSPGVPASYCSFTLPTEQLWLALFIANAALVFVVIPFATFYYEADSEL